MLIIGSRGSKLALAQSTWVKQQIARSYPEDEVAIRIIRTSMDHDQTTSIRSSSATGVFVKEIEEALARGEIDLAVHSMKDLPTATPDALVVGAIPPREDVRDALIAGGIVRSLAELPRSATVGTGSIRRQAQLLAQRPDLCVKDIRGNVDTRLAKLEAGDYDAILLACAGMNRLGIQEKISLRLEVESMLPAPGQGALALEIRRGDSRAAEMIAGLNHAETAIAVGAEREFLRAIGGGCNSPVAVHARAVGGEIRIEGMAAAPDGSKVVRESVLATPADAQAAAAALAESILAHGGRSLLASPVQTWSNRRLT